MKSAVRIWCVALAALVGAALLVLPATASPQGPQEAQRVQRLATLEEAILDRVNQVRVAHGLTELRVSHQLESAAVSHSQSMVAKGFFAHESSDGSAFNARLNRFYPLAGYSHWWVGENLVYSTNQLNAAGAVRAWMGSPAHREDMLAPRWRETGIGAVHASKAGGLFKNGPVWMVTMDFGVRTHG